MIDNHSFVFVSDENLLAQFQSDHYSRSDTGKKYRITTDRFFPGNSPWLWMTKADQLGGSSLPIALVIYRKQIMASAIGRQNKIGLESGEPFGVGRSATRDALERLTKAGLIKSSLKPGSKRIVTITQESLETLPGKKHLFIYPQIPWDWICKAARCTTPGLLVGLAVWRAFQMTPGEDLAQIRTDRLIESDRTAREIRRGMKALESSGLIEILKVEAKVATVKIKDVC